MISPISGFLNTVLTNDPRTTNMWSLELHSGIDVVDKQFEDLTLYARDFKLPSRNIKYSNMYFKGVPIPVPVNPEFDNQTSFNMWADVGGKAHAALRTWQDMVIDMDFQGGSYVGGTRQLNASSTLRLNLLDKDMQTTLETVTLIGVTVAKVGSISFTQNSGDICNFDVSFYYAWPSFE